MDDGDRDRDRAELRVLRARVFGPDADIADDPAAVARLRELEASSSAHLSTLTDDPGRPPVEVAAIPVTPRDVGALESDPPPGEGADGAESSAAPSAPASLGRRRIIAWGASLVFAALAGGGAVALTTAPASSVDGARYATTLRADDDFVAPSWIGPAWDDVRAFRDWRGLTVLASTEDWAGESDECLAVVLTAELGEDAPSWGHSIPGCADSPFAPTVSMTVDSTFPEPLRRTFAEGTAVQFVLEDDEVRVFVARPSARPTPTGR